jgi:hypothetical protein
MQLLIDSGPTQEAVVVGGVGANSFTANFKNPHPPGFAIGNAILGNPGPQPRFDMRRPEFNAIVPFFSVIE